jgi:hypothetical protein
VIDAPLSQLLSVPPWAPELASLNTQLSSLVLQRRREAMQIPHRVLFGKSSCKGARLGCSKKKVGGGFA